MGICIWKSKKLWNTELPARPIVYLFSYLIGRKEAKGEPMRYICIACICFPKVCHKNTKWKYILCVLNTNIWVEKILKSLLLPSILKEKQIKGWKDTSLHTDPFFQIFFEHFPTGRNNHPCPAPAASHSFLQTCSEMFDVALCSTQYISVEADMYLFK